MNILVTLLYEGKDRERLPIYRRWIEYYESIREHLPWDKMLFIDNDSSGETLADILQMAPRADIMHFAERMERTGQHQYPYCWRAWKFMQQAGKYYQPERMYAIDPDFFILSGRCARAIREASDGWYSLWSPHHNFPAVECSVVHGTGFSIHQGYDIGDPYQYDEVAENVLPVTPIKDFIGDRYGEMGITQIKPEWDYIGQLNDTSIEVVFRP